MRTLKKEDAIWLAGLFEGDGTTGLFKQQRRNKKWRILSYFLISNCDPIIINEVRKIAEKKGIGMILVQRNKEHRKYRLNYQIACKNFGGIYSLLEEIHPYLRGNKKAVAEMTMQFIRNREFGKTRKPYSEESWMLEQECKKLNKRGANKKLEPSETLRQALSDLANINSDEKVRTSMKVGEWIKVGT